MKITDALADLTFDLELDDDERISDAVVLCRLTRMSDGRTTFGIAKSEGADVVTVTGLVECAHQIGAEGWQACDDDD